MSKELLASPTTPGNPRSGKAVLLMGLEGGGRNRIGEGRGGEGRGGEERNRWREEMK